MEIVKFDVEVFRASLAIGWTNPVELLVQPDGVFFRMNERCEVRLDYDIIDVEFKDLSRLLSKYYMRQETLLLD